MRAASGSSPAEGTFAAEGVLRRLLVMRWAREGSSVGCASKLRTWRGRESGWALSPERWGQQPRRFSAAGSLSRFGRGSAALFLLACSLLSSGCKAEPWPLWESYSAKFLDGQGRVINHSANDVSTTEGQAYAMFFALVTDDRIRFTKLLDWTETNMAGGDLTLRLPAWNWGKAQDGSWRVLDANSAGDADLWMAYTLCEAGRLWKVERYRKLGEVLASRVARQELTLVPGLGTTLLPGPDGFHPQPSTWYLNPSYLPPMLLAYFAGKQPQTPWKQALASLPGMLGAGGGGYVMDWLKADKGTLKPSPTPAAAQESQGDAAPLGSYDAIRVYLWMGMANSRTPAVKESLASMRGMAAYLNTHGTPPLRVDPDGKVLDADAPAGFSAAVIPYLHALHLPSLEKAQNDRLQATRDTGSGLYGRGGEYYDQNLALFATGWAEQRFRFQSDGQLRVKWK